MSNTTYKSVEFEVINEDWNHYKLPNGAIIKFKTVVQAIFEQTGTSDEITGLPNYTVRSNNVIGIIPPETEE